MDEINDAIKKIDEEIVIIEARKDTNTANNSNDNVEAVSEAQETIKQCKFDKFAYVLKGMKNASSSTPPSHAIFT